MEVDSTEFNNELALEQKSLSKYEYENKILEKQIKRFKIISAKRIQETEEARMEIRQLREILNTMGFEHMNLREMQEAAEQFSENYSVVTGLIELKEEILAQSSDESENSENNMRLSEDLEEDATSQEHNECERDVEEEVKEYKAEIEQLTNELGTKASRPTDMLSNREMFATSHIVAQYYDEIIKRPLRNIDELVNILNPKINRGIYEPISARKIEVLSVKVQKYIIELLVENMSKK